MPHKHYSCDRREVLTMGDYNLPSLYNNRCEEKLCKYSYAPWCPTCDKNPPRRRRSRSETNEPCRRKCREMKTFTPKKYSRYNNEHENMDVGYDPEESWYYEPKEYRNDCRIRSNLCELPTTYISNIQTPANNCQVPVVNNIKMSDSVDYVNCFQKNVKTCELVNYKFVDDLDNQIDNFESMDKRPPRLEERTLGDTLHKFSPHKYEHVKTLNCPSLPYHDSLRSPSRPLRLPTQKILPDVKSKPNGIVYNSPNANGYVVGSKDTKLVNYKEKKDNQHHDDTKNSQCDKPHFRYNGQMCQTHLERCGVQHDMCTYFDKKASSTDLRDTFSAEIKILREKLASLRKNTYTQSSGKMEVPLKDSKICNGEPSDNNCLQAQGDMSQNAVSNSGGIKVKRKGIISPPLIKGIRSRVALKTRSKMSAVKLRKGKTKGSIEVKSFEGSETECSASDESEEEPDVYEESDSVGECSSNEVNKDTPLEEVISSTVTSVQPEAGDFSEWPLRPSLFPHIPPYIRFSSHELEEPARVPQGKQHFKWKLSTITPVLVRNTLKNSGFILVRSEFSRESNVWLGTWGKHMKSPVFKTLKVNQKLNHFPGTFHLGRKDRLWRNFQRLINKFGTREFGFLPHSYVLPQELRLLKQNWEFKNGSGGELWIIKPPASARGVGIKVINKWSQLPKKMSLVVQKYISNPYLINGSKFDLRLYVLVTSFNPLRIYMYPEGLARFASAKYSDEPRDLKDRYMHLTNYSINKLSSQYTPNENADACQGHKWTISKLFEYMESQGVDTRVLWKNLEQLVIKTMITSEAPISQLCEENMNSRYNCYELFGIDVLLDEKLKPWLLEVNISPSLHSASPLDTHVKGPMVETLFNLAQFHFPTRLARSSPHGPQCYDPRLYTMTLTRKEKHKHVHFEQLETRDDYIDDILSSLTGDDVRHLTQAEDELVVQGRFSRIFPTSTTYKYHRFMETRYYNRLFDAWEAKYENNRQAGIALLQSLCAQRIHLKVAPQTKTNKSSPSTNLGQLPKPPPSEEQSPLPLLTGVMQDVAIANNNTVNIAIAEL